MKLLLFFLYGRLDIPDELSQRTEFIKFEKVRNFRVICKRHFHFLRTDIDFQIGLDGDEFVAEMYMSLCIGKCLLLLRGQLIYMTVDVFYVVIFRDKLSCSYLSDTFDSRYISNSHQ